MENCSNCETHAANLREINRLRAIVRTEEDRRNYYFNNFLYFTTNFPPRWVEKCWPGNTHILEKYQNVIHKSVKELGYVTSGDIMNFVFQLDLSNRKVMMDWINENYTWSEATKERLGL